MTEAASPGDIRRRLDAAPMSRVQVGAVAIAVTLSALDGYDVLSITFAAPAITLDWHVGKAALGMVLSSGLVGMALGSFLIGPFADLYGRRRLALLGLVLMAAGSLLCAFATTLPQLAAWRVVTGLGVGTCVAVINPIAAEFANGRRRALALSLLAMGYSVGGLIGGLLSAVLLKLSGWPAVFVAGFVAAMILLPIVALHLPESLAFLVNDRRPGNLDRLNALLGRCGQAPVAEMPAATVRSGRGYAAIFQPGQIGTTIRITAVNVLSAATAFYLFSWMPQMVADAGFAPAVGSLVAGVTSLVGLAGAMTVGAFANRAGLNRLTVVTMIAFGLLVAAFGATPPSLPLLLLVAAVCGFFMMGSAAGFFATLAASFGDSARASGTGFVVGTGRISSAIAPSLAGWLFASGLGRAEVSLAFGSLAVVGGLLLATGGRRAATASLPVHQPV